MKILHEELVREQRSIADLDVPCHNHASLPEVSAELSPWPIEGLVMFSYTALSAVHSLMICKTAFPFTL